MSNEIERFKKRKARSITSGETGIGKQGRLVQVEAETVDAALSPLALDTNDHPGHAQTDPDALLAEIHGHIDAQKFEALIDSCQRECLQSIVRPFLLGRILFEDKMGGNVVTVHNVCDPEYIQSDNTAYVQSGEAEKYKNRGDYNSRDYHGDKNYIRENKKTSKAMKNGGVEDAYTDKKIYSNKNLDHVTSAKEIHDDRARVLAEMDGPELANMKENLKPTTEVLNKGKKQKSVDDFLYWVDHTKLPSLNKNIATLEAKKNRTADEETKLKKLKSDKAQYQSIDREKIKSADVMSRKKINREKNSKYYTSAKFLGNTALTSAQEGGKMAFQQALGVLMEEFVRTAFVEVRDVWKNGFKGKVDDSFLDALKERLMRVAKRVQSKWKDAVYALRGGFISGFLSNLVTILVNVFATTAAKYVRMIREGGMVLYRAVKILALPDEDVSLEETADAAVKVLAAGLVTIGGLALESALDPYLKPLGPLADGVADIVIGIATGFATAFTVYLLDRVDLFGVQAKSRHEHVIERLIQAIDVSEERCLEASAIFDEPLLPHLS